MERRAEVTGPFFYQAQFSTLALILCDLHTLTHSTSLLLLLCPAFSPSFSTQLNLILVDLTN